MTTRIHLARLLVLVLACFSVLGCVADTSGPVVRGFATCDAWVRAEDSARAAWVINDKLSDPEQCPTGEMVRIKLLKALSDGSCVLEEEQGMSWCYPTNVDRSIAEPTDSGLDRGFACRIAMTPMGVWESRVYDVTGPFTIDFSSAHSVLNMQVTARWYDHPAGADPYARRCSYDGVLR